MAQHTKQPEVLRELFEALGNDPFVIAECLARPTLAARFVADLPTQEIAIRCEFPPIAGLSSLSMAAILPEGTYTLPNISDQCGNERDTDPPYDPHHRDAQIVVRALRAEQARGDRERERCRHDSTQRADGSPWDGGASNERVRRATARMVFAQRLVAREEGDECEGQHDRRARAGEPERERQRQVETLTEAVRQRRGRSACKADERGDAETAPAVSIQAAVRHSRRAARPWRSHQGPAAAISSDAPSRSRH